MKNIDIKSLIIGALLTSTIFLGVASTGKDGVGKWDKDQMWEITACDPDYRPGTEFGESLPRAAKMWREAAEGAEPFAIRGKEIIFRKRIN
jgi:hypothetical protein